MNLSATDRRNEYMGTKYKSSGSSSGGSGGGSIRDLRQKGKSACLVVV